MPSWNLMLLTYIKMYVVRFSMFTEVAWFIEEYFLIPKSTWLKMCVLFSNVILHLIFLNNICFLNKVLNFLVNSFCNNFFWSPVSLLTQKLHHRLQDQFLSFLKMLKENGKKLFLMTNSPYYFVDGGMRYMLEVSSDTFAIIFFRLNY